jgi:hypothetical protein
MVKHTKDTAWRLRLVSFSYCGPFQWFHEPALSLVEGFNRFVQIVMLELSQRKLEHCGVWKFFRSDLTLNF